MDEDRRTFLRRIGYAVAGVAGGFPLLRAFASSRQAPPPQGSVGRKQLGMVIDVKKCLQEGVRRACVEACKREHSLPELPEGADPQREVKWIWSEDYDKAFPDQTHGRLAAELRGQPVLLLCNHCTHPACVKVCPTAATWKRKEDGIVMMDMHRCIGCRYCVVACPYGTRRFNWGDARAPGEGEARSSYPIRARGVVEKCNFCAERIRADSKAVPACVEAVEKLARGMPAAEGALTFGDLSDPNSAVSKLLRENRTICRKLGLGTGPNVYYIV